MNANHTSSSYYYPHNAGGHRRQPSSFQPSPITPRPHQDEIVGIHIRDGATNHSHGPYYLARAAVERESRELMLWLGRDQPLSLVDCFSRGYTCCILDCIVRSWRTSERFQGFEPLPGMQPMDEVTQLIQLSRALWDYQCQTSWFEDFARTVRERYFLYDHVHKIHCQEWAFISVVFSWQDEFGRAVMDVTELGHPWPPEQPELNGSAQSPWMTGPVDLAVLRYIIPTNFYLYVQNTASEFINSTWTRLCRGRNVRDARLHELANRVEEHFAQRLYSMPRDDDDAATSRLRTPSMSSNGSSNLVFFQSHSAVDLWRIFEDFFPRGEPEPRRQPRPTPGRVRSVPRFWRSGSAASKRAETDEDIANLRERVTAWYNETFRELLFQPVHVNDTFGDVLWRFNEARKMALIVSGASDVLGQQIHELPAHTHDAPDAEPQMVDGRSQTWHGNGLTRRFT